MIDIKMKYHSSNGNIITTTINSNHVPRNSFFIAAVRSYLKSDKIAEFDSIDSKDGQIKYLLENKAHNALMQVRLVNFYLVSILPNHLKIFTLDLIKEFIWIIDIFADSKEAP